MNARSTVQEGSIVAVNPITGKLMLRREPTITMDGFQVVNTAGFLGLEKVIIQIPNPATAIDISDPAGDQYLSPPIVT